MTKKFRETRVLKRVSQYLLALESGVSQTRISLIENELVIPRDDEKEKIAGALGLKVEDIFEA